MQIAHIKIRNILGIEELDFSPTGFTQIRGKNGTGKTSVIEAIKATLKGGHDATLLRKGAVKGEVVILLDDGTEVARRVTESGTTTDVRQGGKKVAKPVDALRQITDALSVNPIEFLLARPADRVRVLLESLPLEADAQRLSQIVGKPVNPAPGVHALVLIDNVRREVYDERTGVNRAAKEKEGTIITLRQALPPDAPGSAGDETELEAKIAEMDVWLKGEAERIDNKLLDLRRAKDQNIEIWSKQIAELQSKIATAREEYTEWERKALVQKQKNNDRHAADTGSPRLELARIRSDRDAYARRQQTMDTIGALEVEVEDLQTQASAQTQALEAIDSYKLELLQALPVAGLEIRGDELYCEGVQFDRLNTGKQVEIAVEIAKARAGKLGVVCVDRIESLDPEMLEQFRERAHEAGVQMFVTKVTGDEFTIDR